LVLGIQVSLTNIYLWFFNKNVNGHSHNIAFDMVTHIAVRVIPIEIHFTIEIHSIDASHGTYMNSTIQTNIHSCSDSTSIQLLLGQLSVNSNELSTCLKETNTMTNLVCVIMYCVTALSASSSIKPCQCHGVKILLLINKSNTCPDNLLFFLIERRASSN